MFALIMKTSVTMESKITIKHFLNTNLKPYVMNGENYYPIYLLVTAKRRTTKLKSLEFSELYKESDFKDIFNSTNKEDIQKVNNEIVSLENIARLIIGAIDDFNTIFFTAYVKYSNSLTFWDIEIEEVLPFNKNNVLGVKLDKLYLDIQDNELVENTIFEVYGAKWQTKALDYLKALNIDNYKEVLNDINKVIFYTSISNFRWFIEGSKKTTTLKKLYPILFDNYNGLILSELENKYNKDK